MPGLKTNKFSILLIAYFTCQVSMDLAGSISMFPFLHAGMYSAVFQRPDSLQVFEIVVNDKKLYAGDFRMHVWDMMHQPLYAFQKQSITNDFAKEKSVVEKIIGYSGNLDNDSALPERFPAWYKQYVEGLIGKKIQSLRVEKVNYHYENGGLRQLSSEKWINL